MFGDATTGLPAPGYAVPYAFSQQEISDFLNVFQSDPVVTGYVIAKTPAYGVIFTAPPGNQLLLWFDASNVFHVIDVTGQPIVAAVNQPEFISPDSSLWQNIMDQTAALIAKLPSGQQLGNWAEVLAVLVALFLVAQIVKEV
jgi:hypothetical protein